MGETTDPPWVHVQLSEELMAKVETAARHHGVSVNDFISEAVKERLSCWKLAPGSPNPC
jgi:HicB family